MKNTIAFCAALAAVFALAACEAPKPAAPPAPPAPPSPPSPELPMTPAKAREIIGDLPLACSQFASLKMDMLTCEERQGHTADHAALRTELRDLRWNLQSLPAEEATKQCAAKVAELQTHAKPRACWDLGVS